MLNNRFNVNVTVVLMLSVALWPAVGWATGLVPCEGLNCTVDHLFILFVMIYNFLLAATALVAMLFVVVGGIRMFFVAASASEMESAKKTVQNAIIGLVIIAGAYLIVNTLIDVLGGGGLRALFRRLGLPRIF